MNGIFGMGADCKVQGGDRIFDDITGYMEERITEYVEWAAELVNIKESDLKAFRDEALRVINELIDEHGLQNEEFGVPWKGEIRHEGLKKAQAELETLKDVLTISYCDKHQDQLTLLCRRLYAFQAWLYLDNNKDTYVKVTESEADIARRITKVVEEKFDDVFWFRRPSDPDDNSQPTKKSPLRPTKVGHLQLTIKYHKKPRPAFRPIIASKDKPEVPTARVVNAALRFINNAVCDQMWHDLILTRIGLSMPRSCSLIGCEGLHAANGGILRKLIARGEIDGSKVLMASYDFTAMYTKFTHKMIIDALTELLTYAFRRQAIVMNKDCCYLAVPKHQDYQRSTAFWFGRDKFPSNDKRDKKFTLLSLSSLIDRIKFLLDSTYIFFGGEVFKQDIGLPMGLVPAGLLASLTCFTYEIAYAERVLDRLSRTPPSAPDYEEVRARAYFIILLQRYIDDEIHYLINKDVFDSKTALYDERTAPGHAQDGGPLDGMYPTTSVGPKGEVVQMPCELECVHEPSREINFLDWSVAIIGDGRIITDVFDKRTGMEIYKNVRKFPHRASVMSNKIRYNVVTSQLIRYARRCTRYRDFLRNSAKLVAAMWAHGYRRDLLQHKILAFGRYWRRHCAHLGRFQDFARDFPRAVDEQLRTR